MKKVGSPLWASYKQYVQSPKKLDSAKSHLSHSSFKIRDRKNRSRKKDWYSYNMYRIRFFRVLQKDTIFQS